MFQQQMQSSDDHLDDDMPLEDQLRLTAIKNPCLTTDEIVVLTNAQAVSTRSASNRKHATR